MSLLGSIATGIVGTVNPVAGLALKALGWVKGVVKNLSPKEWLALAALAALAAAVIYVLILRGDIRHDEKVIAGQAATLGAVKKEVDRGVGKPTDASNAPAYIRGFVDNLATVTAALDRQSAALKVAQQQAESHVAAAHEAAQPTQAQGERDKVRQKIVDPARTTGLTSDEWGKL